MDQLSSAIVAARGEYDRPWKRIANDMREKVSDGRWRSGDRLPTIAELQVEYQVSKNTIRGALGQLREEGLLDMRGRSLYVQSEDA